MSELPQHSGDIPAVIRAMIDDMLYDIAVSCMDGSHLRM